MSWLKRLIPGRKPKPPLGSNALDAEIQQALLELSESKLGEDKQIVFETYAHCLLSDRCAEVVDLLVQSNRAHLAIANHYKQLGALVAQLRKRGLEVFGPLPTPNTCEYPGMGPGVLLAEQLAGSPMAAMYQRTDGATGGAGGPMRQHMLPLEEQVKSAMMDLVQHWELGHMKNAITPGLGDIGPFIRKRAYLVLTDRMIGAFQSIAMDRRTPDMAKTAGELAALLSECRRDGIDAALLNNPQPGLEVVPPEPEPEPVSSGGQGRDLRHDVEVAFATWRDLWEQGQTQLALQAAKRWMQLCEELDDPVELAHALETNATHPLNDITSDEKLRRLRRARDTFRQHQMDTDADRVEMKLNMFSMLDS